ncbi:MULTISPECIES: hypothetical protein [unclassified Mesorhizobium]|uniref:hypothetical protein n=1 Tax=unclassified Mesorhizobium TaxID=325217 RepID=UPI00040D09CE|nr:hypothetical protein [Mesorhizobium sp. LSJC280B00]
MFVGALLTILGLPIGGGGAWLIALGGSWYYLPAGIALLAAGSLLLAGNAAGVWLYVLTWLATLAPGGHHFMETRIGDDVIADVIAYALPKS